MEKVILAFDPGLSNLGHACLQGSKDGMEYVESGIHTQKSKFDVEEKLFKIHEFIESQIYSLNPDVIAYEKMFFRGRSDSAASTIKVIGFIQILAEKYNIPSIGVSPPTLKKFITGNGRADKNEMKKYTLDKLLSLGVVIEEKSKHHEIDAFAVGLWALEESENV